MTKKRKSPVEIAAAHANAMIVAVESDDGRNDGIEHPGGYDVTIHRFENTVAVRAKIRVGRYFAKLPLQIYFAHRGKNALFHSPCARDYFPGADLVGCRQIAREILRTLKPGGSNDFFCNDRRRSVTGQLIERIASHPSGLPDKRLVTAHDEIGKSWSGEKRGVSRLCRYRPSLSNRSNRWGQPWQQQAYHRSGPAQMLPTEYDPEVKI